MKTAAGIPRPPSTKEVSMDRRHRVNLWKIVVIWIIKVKIIRIRK